MELRRSRGIRRRRPEAVGSALPRARLGSPSPPLPWRNNSRQRGEGEAAPTRRRSATDVGGRALTLASLSFCGGRASMPRAAPLLDGQRGGRGGWAGNQQLRSDDELTTPASPTPYPIRRRIDDFGLPLPLPASSPGLLTGASAAPLLLPGLPHHQSHCLCPAQIEAHRRRLKNLYIYLY
jgi:hypothetical protein